MFKKNIRKVICVVVAMLIVLQVMPSTMVNAVTPAPGVYTSSASTVTLEADLSGISTNSHTRPEFVWIDGSTVFVAVRMTHNLNKMSIGTANRLFSYYREKLAKEWYWIGKMEPANCEEDHGTVSFIGSESSGFAFGCLDQTVYPLGKSIC